MFYVCLPANINYAPLSLYERFDDKPKCERASGKAGNRNPECEQEWKPEPESETEQEQ